MADSVREAFLAALQAGQSTAEATRIANASRTKQFVDMPLPTAAEIAEMGEAELRKFLTAEAVTIPSGATESEMRAIAFEAIGVKPEPAEDDEDAADEELPGITREEIETMDKPELLELLRARGVTPDGRTGVDKLREQAIELIE